MVLLWNASRLQLTEVIIFKKLLNFYNKVIIMNSNDGVSIYIETAIYAFTQAINAIYA